MSEKMSPAEEALIDELIRGATADIDEILARRESDTYELQFNCLNCSFKGAARIKKGRPISHFPCPYCGCCPKDI